MIKEQEHPEIQISQISMEEKIMMGVGMAPQIVITRTITATLQPRISSKGWLTQRSQKSVTAVMNAISKKMNKVLKQYDNEQ